MYKMFDLYNNYFTNKKLDKTKMHYLNKCSKLQTKLATVIDTTNLKSQKIPLALQKAEQLLSNGDYGLLAVEDLNFVTKSTINDIINYGIRFCGLTGCKDNILAGGYLEQGDITNFGKYCIEQLENADIFVDCANLNERSFMTLCNTSNKALFCSHTASNSIIANQQNLKDYQIKIVCASGGLIGVCLDSYLLCGSKNATITDYVKHIDYMVCKFGIEHFAIGTNFFGTKTLPLGITDYKSLKKLLVEQLEYLGYKPTDINKLLFQNAERFFKI